MQQLLQQPLPEIHNALLIAFWQGGPWIGKGGASGKAPDQIADKGALPEVNQRLVGRDEGRSGKAAVDEKITAFGWAVPILAILPPIWTAIWTGILAGPVMFFNHFTGGAAGVVHALAHHIDFQPQNFAAQVADCGHLDQMGGHVFGVGFARQAVAVAVGAPDQEDKVKGRVGSVRQFALLTRIEDTKSLRLLKIVQFFECCVSIGPNAPPL